MPPPLALIHGFTGSPASWQGVLDALAERPRVVAPPLLGHQGCAQQAPLSGGFEAEVDRLADELRAARVGAGADSSAAPERYHLCGYSLGGRLALGLLLRHPDLFAGATIVGAHHGLASEGERRERRASDERWCALLESEGLDAFIERWEALPLFASQASASPEALRAQRSTRRAQSASGLAASLRTVGLGAMPYYLPRLASVAAPVTLLTGALDEKFDALACAMREAAPSIAHRRVRGAGHNLILERPEAIAEALARGAP